MSNEYVNDVLQFMWGLFLLKLRFNFVVKLEKEQTKLVNYVIISMGLSAAGFLFIDPFHVCAQFNQRDSPDNYSLSTETRFFLFWFCWMCRLGGADGETGMESNTCP